MALYLVQLPGSGAEARVNGVGTRIIEADSVATARRIAAAQVGNDADWDDASVTVTAITAGVAADYTGFRYGVKVSSDPAAALAPDLLDVSYVGVASDTVDLIGAALATRICGSAVAAGIADDGGVYTNETTAANNATADDVHLLPAVPVTGDAFIVGSATQFNRVLVNVTTAGVGTFSIAWKYWNGAAWAALTGVTDDTGSFKNAGPNDVVFTCPSNWATSTINAQGPFYFVKAEVTYTSSTTVPLAGQIWVGPGFRGSYNSGTNVLTVAAIADDIGDSALAVEAKLPGAAAGLSDLVGTIVHRGIAGAVLSVVLEAETAIPAIML